MCGIFYIIKITVGVNEPNLFSVLSASNWVIIVEITALGDCLEPYVLMVLLSLPEAEKNGKNLLPACLLLILFLNMETVLETDVFHL